MTHPYCKHDELLKKDLRPRERLEPARNILFFAIQHLEQFAHTTENASDKLTDEQLETICRACDMALNAALNCSQLGVVGYHAMPVETVRWKD